MKKLNGLLLFLIGILIGGIIMKFGPENIVNKINEYSIVSTDNEIDYYHDKYKHFEKIDYILSHKYYDYENIDQKLMMKKSLKAYVDAINDPYTVYMDVQENSGFVESLEGKDEFEGIGAAVVKKDDYILVEEIIKDSPAFKSGLKQLDHIVKIDTGDVKDYTLENAVSKMRGPKGTTVVLLVERYSKNKDKQKETIKIDIIRGKIDISSVTSQILNIDDKKILYMEIFIIGEETENLFKKEIEDIKGSKIDGIILDLRGNGGGLMPIAVDIASHFVSKDKIIVSAKYKGYENESYLSKGYGDFEGMELVVLINGMTASAGEIIAMALQEQAGAKLLGTTTFGKGTIQTLDEFENGDSIKYTIGKWFPPSKKNINQIGVNPDIIVEFDMGNYIDNNYDNQLEEAKSIFK